MFFARGCFLATGYGIWLYRATSDALSDVYCAMIAFCCAAVSVYWTDVCPRLVVTTHEVPSRPCVSAAHDWIWEMTDCIWGSVLRMVWVCWVVSGMVVG